MTEFDLIGLLITGQVVQSAAQIARIITLEDERKRHRRRIAFLESEVREWKFVSKLMAQKNNLVIHGN